MGAIDTFDAKAYRAVLQRLRDDDGQEFAPGFDRTVEAPAPRAITVPASCRLIVTEGNYLLDEEAPWPAIRQLLDEVWFLDLDESTRLERLVARHVEFGKTQAEAASWVRDVDEPNAARVLAQAGKADVVVSGA
jgi:pantothenate kinase